MVLWVSLCWMTMMRTVDQHGENDVGCDDDDGACPSWRVPRERWVRILEISSWSLVLAVAAADAAAAIVVAIVVVALHVMMSLLLSLSLWVGDRYTWMEMCDGFVAVVIAIVDKNDVIVVAVVVVAMMMITMWVGMEVDVAIVMMMMMMMMLVVTSE